MTVYLGLGSNLGDRAANLAEARRRLRAAVIVDAVSRIYETSPWGLLDQPPFLNQVVRGRTALAPHELLTALKGIEAEMGRRASVRYGPRLIDVDLLVYGDAVVETETLTVPHPRMADRAFVLIPFAELAPNLLHPMLGRTIADLARMAPGRDGVVPWPSSGTTEDRDEGFGTEPRPDPTSGL